VNVASRTAGGLILVVGVVAASLLLGDLGALVGVVIAMVGFQLLTRRVEGAPYVTAAIATTVCLVFIAWQHSLTWTELGLGRSTWLTGLLWAGGIILAVGAVIGIAGGIPWFHKFFADERHADADGLQTTRKVLLDIPLGTVLIEEFAFRGVLLGLMVQQWSTLWAVVGTSILFGLWHILPALEMHEAHQEATGHKLVTVGSTVLFTGLSGVGFALLRLWTGSLFPPAALHWAANGTGIVVGFFVNRRLAALAEREPLDPDADPE
jgi:membrane protease YdiL (CAAX protease family)